MSEDIPVSKEEIKAVLESNTILDNEYARCLLSWAITRLEELECEQQQTRFDRFFAAALQGILARPVRWRKSYSDNVQKAAEYARLALEFTTRTTPAQRGEDS